MSNITQIMVAFYILGALIAIAVALTILVVKKNK
jgi:hypothetical protein